MNFIKSIKPTLLALPLFLGTASADYISGSLDVSGLAASQDDAAEDKAVYQSESFFLHGNMGDVYITGSYRYSDYRDLRPNTYVNNHRIGVTQLRYAPAEGWFSLGAGRDFIPFLNRNVLYDGGQAALRYKKFGYLEGYVGFNTPDDFTEEIMDFSQDRYFFGGRLTATPLPGTVIKLDLSSEMDMDTLDYAAGFQQEILPGWSMSGDLLYDDIIEEFTHFNLATRVKLRKHDRVDIRWSREDHFLDSLPSYEYFVHPERQVVGATYLFYMNDHIFASLGAGYLHYDEFDGQMADLKIGAYDALVSVSNATGTDVNRLGFSAAYNTKPWKFLGAGARGGYTLYSLNGEDNKKALYAALNLKYILKKNYSLGAEYQFLSNEYYTSDHRLYFGIKANYFKGLDKE